MRLTFRSMLLYVYFVLFFNFLFSDSAEEFDGYNKMNMTSSLDLKTGVFTAPTAKEYIVTLNALLSPTDAHRLQTYAQMFLLKNGELTSTRHYAVVRLTGVTSLTDTVFLGKDDKLEVFVGHHVDNLTGFGPSGTVRIHDGGHMDQIRFCIF